MGLFGSNSRKQAKQQQLQAMQLQQTAYNNALAQQQQYQASSAKRNAGVQALQDESVNWMARYNKGEDVASLNPAFARHAQESSQAIMNTMNVASNLGDNATHVQGDKGYQDKLRSVASRHIAKGLAGMNMQGLENELNSRRGIIMDTSNFLNSDARVGFGMSSDLFGMTNSIFNAATTRRQMEIQRSNQMMNNLMAGISGGLTGLITAGSSNGMFGAGGMFGRT